MYVVWAEQMFFSSNKSESDKETGPSRPDVLHTCNFHTCIFSKHLRKTFSLELIFPCFFVRENKIVKRLNSLREHWS